MRRFIASSLLIASCSGGASNPKTNKEAPKPEPKTAPVPAVVAPPPETKPIVTSEAASEPAKAASTVVFVIDSQRAIPLACFDATTKTFIDTKDANANCAKLTQPSQQIKLSINSGTTLREKSEWVCEQAEFKKIAFAFDPKLPETSMTELGVYPPTASAMFVSAVGETKFTVEPPDEKLLQEAILKAEPSAKKKLTVHQIARADLDGDSKEDTLFSITVPSSGMSGDSISSIEAQFAFSGVFQRSGAKPEELLLLKRENSSTFEVRGFVDINGDGRKELILSDAEWEGFGIVAYEVAPDGTLKELGDWGCGS